MKVLTFSLLLAISACSVESNKEELLRNHKSMRQTGDQSGECQYRMGRSCVSGKIVGGPGFWVAGRRFFDVNEFKTRFPLLLKGNFDADKDTYRIDPPLTNESFLDDFSITIKGPGVDNAPRMVYRGHFNFDDLMPGYYTVRVLKRLVMNVIRGDQIEESCWVLYSDIEGILLRRHSKERLVLDRFDVRRVSDDVCGIGANSEWTQ